MYLLMRNSILCIAGILVILAGCTPAVKPVPSVILENEKVMVPGDGGTYSVGYRVENPIDDTTVPTVSSETVDWVSDFTVTSSEISFKVEKAGVEQSRLLVVEVSYPEMKQQVRFTIEQLARIPDFAISSHDVNTNGFQYDVKPLNETQTYLIFVTEKRDLILNGINTEEELWEKDKKWLEEQIGSGLYTLEEFVKTGEQKDIQSGFAKSGTDYVVYSYGIDVENFEKTTEISYLEIPTLKPESVACKFDISVQCNGPVISGSIATDYDKHYYYRIFTEDEIEEQKEFGFSDFDIVKDSWDKQLVQCLGWGMEISNIVLYYSFAGTKTLSEEKTPDTGYVILAVALDDDGNVCSDVTAYSFKTGEITLSDNRITIAVAVKNTTTASIKVRTTNDDQYAYICDRKSFYEGMTSEEIMNTVMMDFVPRHGDFDDEITWLSPDTEYYVIAFGCVASHATTDLVLKEFKTPATEMGTTTFELIGEDYYSIADLLKIEKTEKLQGFANMGWQVLFPVKVKVSPEAKGFYSTIVGRMDFYETMTDDQWRSTLMAIGTTTEEYDYCCQFGTVPMLVGFSVDENDRPGPVWKKYLDEFTKDGASDPQKYFE